jgi:hypothetical protein
LAYLPVLGNKEASLGDVPIRWRRDKGRRRSLYRLGSFGRREARQAITEVKSVLPKDLVIDEVVAPRDFDELIDLVEATHRARHEQPARPCLSELMKQCATTEHIIQRQREKNYQHER